MANQLFEPDEPSSRQSAMRAAGGAPPARDKRWRRELGASWWIFAVCVVIAGGVAYFVSDRQERTYEASASLHFQQQAFDAQIFGNSYIAPTQDANQLAATNQVLVSLPLVASTAARALGRGFTAVGIRHSVTVANVSGSTVETVTAQARTPADAARIANAYVNAYVRLSRDQQRAALTQALSSVQRELANASTTPRVESPESLTQLEILHDRISVLQNLQTGAASVVQTASAPTAPSSPQPKRDAIFGVILGLLVAGGIFGAKLRFDRLLREPEEIEMISGLSLLSVVAHSKALAKGGSPSSVQEVSESIRLLRVRLRYFNVDRVVKSLAVVSAGSGEGKSTVCAHLAVSYVENGARVLIVEADLRQATLSRRLGASAQRGLAEYLADPEIDVSEVVSKHESLPGVDLLLAGGMPPNPAELLDSQRMRQLLVSAAQDYDLVLVDNAPLELVADALPLLTSVDGVLLVARVDVVTRDALARVTADLHRLGAPVLGVVANGYRGRGRAVDYGGYAARGYASPGKPENGRSELSVQGPKARP